MLTGLSDFIWFKGGGLLDKDFNPKPVYNRLMKLIKEDWMTKDLKKTTDKNGKVSFRGFYGKYSVTVTDDKGTIKTFDCLLEEKKDNQWKVNF